MSELQNREMRYLLTQLELLSHGSTQAWNSAGGHGDSPNALPFGESNPPHLVFRDLYLAQPDDVGRGLVIEDARGELKRLRGHGIDRSHVVGETLEAENGRILAEGAGFTADEVARRFKCTPTRVRRLRLAAGHGIEDGAAPVGVVSAEVVDARAEALRMKSQGMTERQIALALRKPKSTVHDWLQAA